MPDNYETIKATEILAKEGFVVMPYMYPDLYVARELVKAGAASIMPLGSFIGSNQGLQTREFIKMLIEEILRRSPRVKADFLKDDWLSFLAGPIKIKLRKK